MEHMGSAMNHSFGPSQVFVGCLQAHKAERSYRGLKYYSGQKLQMNSDSAPRSHTGPWPLAPKISFYRQEAETAARNPQPETFHTPNKGLKCPAGQSTLSIATLCSLYAVLQPKTKKGPAR